MPFLNPEALDKVRDALMSLDPIKVAVAMSMITSARDAIASPGLREEANDKYGTDDIEIDDQPGTSPTDDGLWVAAWVYLPNPDCPSCGDDMARGEAVCEDCREGECKTCAAAIETRAAPCDECGHMDGEA